MGNPVPDAGLFEDALREVTKVGLRVRNRDGTVSLFDEDVMRPTDAVHLPPVQLQQLDDLARTHRHEQQ
jgi:hypothetical protein